jgi:hypothetical protein
MAELVNLNRARKAKAKADRAAEAAANRVRFGRTKAEKLAVKAEAERQGRKLDAARRERDED